jgi:hypothetical protein
LVDVILTVIAIVAFVGFLPFTDFVRVHSMHYRLDESGLTLVGVLWRPKPIPYWQIESARVISWPDRLFLNREVNWFKIRSYTTRELTRKFVVVRHRDGRAFILSPDDPETFVTTLNERIAGTAPPKLGDRDGTSDQHLRDHPPAQRASR